MEEERAEAFLETMIELGVDSAWTDEVGNVIGLRRGSGTGEVLAVAGHLDTVFPPETDVTVRVSGDTIFAPGISDDTRGLATVALAVLRAMNEANIRTEADILFIGNVGEEGLGDLRGVKHLFREGGPKIDHFISVDGTSPNGITHMGLGSHRYRVTFRGPGDTSWGAFGLANPAHAMGRAIRYFQDGAAPYTANAPYRTSYNVGRMGVARPSTQSHSNHGWKSTCARKETRRLRPSMPSSKARCSELLRRRTLCVQEERATHSRCRYDRRSTVRRGGIRPSIRGASDGRNQRTRSVPAMDDRRPTPISQSR